jgi:type I pantothenate kinase
VSDATAVVRPLIDACPRAPVVVGIAGAVASGKTTLAGALRDDLTDQRVDVVTTDGFLLPNAELGARGLLARKGFPESYDVAALRAFVAGARDDGLPLRVPCYSHVTYDIDGEREVPPVDVLIVEGVNALSAAADLLDVGVYVDADEADLASWFRVRFLELTAEAADDPSSFYRMFQGLDDAGVARAADDVWQAVNLPNLRDHIAPSAALARVVIHKAADHTVRAVDLRDDG